MQLIKDSDIAAFLNPPEEKHSVLQAKSWINEVIDFFHKPLEAPKPRLPWSCTHSAFEFRTGEVTLWAGMNGHGKSMKNSHAVLSLLEQGEKVCIASLEMKPYKTMVRMARQAYGHSEPSVNYLEKFGEWTDGKLWLYDHVGQCDAKTMLAVIRYSVATYGVMHFVIDNLMRVISGEDSYNEQKDFVTGLCSIANDTGVHIHLILHVRKLKDETCIPSKFDIKGSGSITDQVDNVFVIWRNKPKEYAIYEDNNSKLVEHDSLLLIEKQRNGEFEGQFGMYFNKPSMQYLNERTEQPRHLKIEKPKTFDEIEF